LISDLESILNKGDIIVMMGAGDIYKRQFDIIRSIKAKYE